MKKCLVFGVLLIYKFLVDFFDHQRIENVK